MKRYIILLVGFCVLVVNYFHAQNNLQKGNDYETAYKTKIPIEWVDIPAGSFIMGSPDDEANRGVDEYQHQVSVDGFNMSKYAITFEQFEAFCDAKGLKKPDDAGWGRGKRPVINISWHDAVEFTIWYGEGCRLPTEAEWEYAFRAGTTTAFNTGDKLTPLQANYYYTRNNSVGGIFPGQTLPVDNFLPNDWGLYNMHGNVMEWCFDRYGMYSNVPQRNPQGPTTGTDSVLRGGSWSDSDERCRSASRDRSDPAYRYNKHGFRVVVSN